MKLTQDQKVAIYAGALQGAISNPDTVIVQGNPTSAAINWGDELIAHLEALTDTDPNEPITD